MGALTISTALVLGHLATCVAGHAEVKAAPPRRVVAHAIAESALHVFALHDNATGEKLDYQTAGDAIAAARDRLARGHRIDAGIMQITDSNWQAYGLSVRTVFDPAANICAGARILAEAFEIERRAACRYNSGRPVCTDYADAIDKAEARIVPLPAAVAAVSQPPAALPPVRPLCAPAWDGMALALCNARRLAAHHATDSTEATSVAMHSGLQRGELLQ